MNRLFPYWRKLKQLSLTRLRMSHTFAFSLNYRRAVSQLVERYTGDRRVAILRESSPTESLCCLLWQCTLSALLSTGSTQKDRISPRYEWIVVDWDVKRQNKQMREAIFLWKLQLVISLTLPDIFHILFAVMSLILVSMHQRSRPACATAQSSQRFCYSLSRKYSIYMQNFSVSLVRLDGA